MITHGTKLVTERGHDQDWQRKYSDYIVTPEEAVKRVRPGDRVFIGTGCSQPQALVKALAERAPSLADTEILHLVSHGAAPYANKELTGHFTVNSLFITQNVRALIREGLGDYTPILLSDVPRLFSSGRMPLDVALIQITPPDEAGYCSLGISVDVVRSAAENARTVIAQVNPQMPRTLGNTMLHIHDMDFLVAVDEALIEWPLVETSEEVQTIGQYVAALIEDGSTLELGIGRVPHAVLAYLHDKKDLGIHTEMISDEVVDLIEAGAITGARKSLDRNKVVASFCVGTRKIYDYIDNNPVFAFHPTEYVNDPYVIAQQRKMVSVNVGLELDLTGQVCSDSLGDQFFSGFGGQSDFGRGAARSKGGKAIIAMPSTADEGKTSRIVTHLQPGGGVVTTRGDVHYVVTEHGVAYLHGKTVQERALALISIAHPDFREQLLEEAIEAKYVRSELAHIGDKIVIAPRELRTSFLLDDGTLVTVRPVHPTDENRVRDLYHRLSPRSMYTRFMGAVKWVSHRQIQQFVYVDHRTVVCIVATIPGAGGEEIIATGGYYLDPKTNRAEVDFVVRDQWQGRHIGTFLLRHLITIARRNGIAGFTAEVLAENKRMQSVFHNSGQKVQSAVSRGVYSYKIDFD